MDWLVGLLALLGIGGLLWRRQSDHEELEKRQDKQDARADALEEEGRDARARTRKERNEFEREDERLQEEIEDAEEDWGSAPGDLDDVADNVRQRYEPDGTGSD